jgi:hypothetical protein
VATTVAYVLTPYFGGVIMSKSEGEEGIVGEKIRGEEGLGKECPQSSFMKLSHIHIFFSHVKQRPLASNLHTQSC